MIKYEPRNRNVIFATKYFGKIIVKTESNLLYARSI